MFMKCECVCVYIHGLPRNMAIGRANFLTIYGLEITKSRRRKWDGKSSIVIVCFGFCAKRCQPVAKFGKNYVNFRLSCDFVMGISNGALLTTILAVFNLHIKYILCRPVKLT